jgi:hypothetical protein
MYRVQAWNALGAKLADPSPPLALREALVVAEKFRKRGLRRITLIDVKTGQTITDLEHLIPSLLDT